jgi:hypothetical protein
VGVINAFYDLRVAPLTFDFLTYLQILQVHLVKNGLSKADLCVVAAEYRRASWIEKGYELDAGYEDRKLSNCILTAALLCPFVRDILLHRGGHSLAYNNLSYPPGFDPGKVQAQSPVSMLPCTNGALANVWREAGGPKLQNVVRPSARAERLLSAQLGVSYVTISLRTTPHNSARNTPIDLAFEVYTRLSEAFPTVKFIVIPDQDDFFFNREAWRFSWDLDLAASFDFDLRVALYKNALTNICWSGGVTSVVWYSDFPYLYLGQWNEASPISSQDFFRRKGPALGEQLPWANSNLQCLDWTEAGSLTGDYCFRVARDMISRAISFSA